MWGWVGLDGRLCWGGDRVPPRWEPGEQDAGDLKGPPNSTSTTLAPTDRLASCLTSRFRLMRMRADQSAMCAINRHLRFSGFICQSA